MNQYHSRLDIGSKLCYTKTLDNKGGEINYAYKAF